MRSHSALYVDAGYLIAAAATRITGSSLRRGVVVDYPQLLKDLIKLVEDRAGLPILRVYWYDAARDGRATTDQELIALLPQVKLRLGRVGVEGEQKGVDLRIGLDMVGHSRNGAVDSMYLLSGDDDLTEAVEEAQAQGVQVIVLAVPTSAGTRHGVSRHLMLAADEVETLDSEILGASVSVASAESANAAPPPSPGTIAHAPSPADIVRASGVASLPRPQFGSASSLAYSSTSATSHQDLTALSPTIEQVAIKTYFAWAKTASTAQRGELLASKPSIPPDLDRALLIDLSDAIGEYTLSDQVRYSLRAEFWKAVDS